MEMCIVYIPYYYYGPTDSKVKYTVHGLEMEYRFNRAYGLPKWLLITCDNTGYIAIL